MVNNKKILKRRISQACLELLVVACAGALVVLVITCAAVSVSLSVIRDWRV